MGGTEHIADISIITVKYMTGVTEGLAGLRGATTMLFIIRSSVLDMMDMMKRKSWGSKNDLDAVMSRKRSAEQTMRARKRVRR